MERLVIDLALLPEDGQLLEDELSSAIFDLPENDAKPLGPLFFSLQVQRFGDELLLQGNLRAPFEFLCVRTLTAFKKTIDLPETTIALEIGTRGEIDATEALREEILLNWWGPVWTTLYIVPLDIISCPTVVSLHLRD